MPLSLPVLSHRVLLGGAAFLLSVLWFDLMFDVQVLGHANEVLPQPVLASIVSYYRRVTTEAYPMNRLIAIVMLVTLIAAVVPLVRRGAGRGLALLSVALAVAPILLAALRVLPNAIRLGAAVDDPATQSMLARSILYDHLFCLASIVTLLAIQLVRRSSG